MIAFSVAFDRDERARDLGRRTRPAETVADAWRRALVEPRRRDDGFRGGREIESRSEDIVREQGKKTRIGGEGSRACVPYRICDKYIPNYRCQMFLSLRSCLDVQSRGENSQNCTTVKKFNRANS